MSESIFQVILLFCLLLIAGVGLFIGFQVKELVDAIAFLAGRV